VRGLSRRIGEVSLLDDVSFTVFSGEVVAMVGPSGAGKTTLLNAINGTAPADRGEVLFDGRPFHPQLQADPSLVGIVPQDDLVLPELRVDESLWYSGRLRYSTDVGRKELGQEVERVLGELGIQHIAGNRIGDALRRGISGGQRKRVNLGQELMTRSTRVLFLDEPTSGLDPRAAQDIVRLARQLADHGRMVFLVTHDLTPEVMAQVDHLLVMAPGGRLAWFGPPEGANAWFGVNTPDAIFNRFQDRPADEWGRHFRGSADFRKYVSTREHLLRLDHAPAAAPPERRAPRPSALRQLWTLSARFARVKWRDRTGAAVLAVQPPILAVVMWLVFPGPTAPMVFMLSLSALWFWMSASVRELIADRVIWRRERRVGVGVLPYLASKVLVMGAIVAVQCLSLVAMLWFARGLAAYGFDPALLCLVSVLTGWAGMALGLFVSACWTSSEAAVGTLPILIIPQIMFSGIMVSLRHMGDAALGITWLTIERFSFHAHLRAAEQVAQFDRLGRINAHAVVSPLYEFGFFRYGDSELGTVDSELSLQSLLLALGLNVLVFLLGAALLVWWRDRRA
jgi:ABC transport system ATP-binding/permease protein